jgi:hypothetical protein
MLPPLADREPSCSLSPRGPDRSRPAGRPPGRAHAAGTSPKAGHGAHPPRCAMPAAAVVVAKTGPPALGVVTDTAEWPDRQEALCRQIVNAAAMPWRLSGPFRAGGPDAACQGSHQITGAARLAGRRESGCGAASAAIKFLAGIIKPSLPDKPTSRCVARLTRTFREAS